jgi:O-methyltransferase involved in polyketide biosynthesis
VSRIALDVMSRRVAAAGEPFRTFFDPLELCARLARIGFREIEDLGPDELNARYFHARADRLRVTGHLGRVMSAAI